MEGERGMVLQLCVRFSSPFFLLFEGEEVKCQRYIVLQLKEYVCGKKSFLAKALVEGSIYSSLFSKNVFVSKSKECRSKLRE